MDLTSEQGVIELMGSSVNAMDWDDNADKVKAANGGYPAFWYRAIIASGLMDRTLGAGASRLRITSLR